MLLVGKTAGKRSSGRPRRRWVDNMRMDVVEIAIFEFHKMVGTCRVVTQPVGSRVVLRSIELVTHFRAIN
jgi:hypothetical protein